MILAKDDILKLEEVLKLNVQDAMYYLSYVVKSNKEKEAQYKKMKS